MGKQITARELAEEKKKNPDDIVCSVSDNFELGNSVVPKSSVYLNRYIGKIVKEGFRDAFDGGSYSTDVVRFDNEGDLTFIQI